MHVSHGMLHMVIMEYLLRNSYQEHHLKLQILRKRCNSDAHLKLEHELNLALHECTKCFPER